MCEDKKVADNQIEMSSLAFEILPGEIWKEIFKHLKGSPSDLAACMNTCGQWYNLLKSERTTVLFPEVFKILAESKEVDWSRKSKKGRRHEDDVNEPLTRTRLLSCRLVSKAWNDTILSFIQWHPTHFQLDELTSENDSHPLDPLGQESWYRDLYKWYNRFAVEQFLQTFGATYGDKNPFVTRSLSITNFHLEEEEMDEEYDAQTFYRLVTRVLEMFGEYLWHFQVDVSFLLTASSYYALLQSWLTLMPNLKTLRIYYSENLNDDDPGIARSQMPIANMMVFHNQIEATPLPVLKNLTVLEISSVPPPLALSLLGSCRNSLERLALEGRLVFEFRKPFTNLPEMPRLKMATMILDNELELMALEKAFLSQDCANLWPLESLYFGYHEPHLLQDDRDVSHLGPSWERLFRFVNLFKDTLTDLRLDLPNVYHDFEKRRIYRQSSALFSKLQLPNLKKLKLILWNRATFDFLLPLEKLEELEILKPGKKAPVPAMAFPPKMKTLRSGRKIWVQQKPSEVIKSHGWYMTHMVDSNIWQKLPCLRVLKIETQSPKKLFDCLVRQVHRVVKRDENGRAEVEPRVLFLF